MESFPEGPCTRSVRLRDDEWGAGVPGQKEMVGHVLGKFAPDERPLLEECLAKAEEATLLMMKEGFQAAANKFNVKKEKKPRKKQEAPAEASPEADPADCRNDIGERGFSPD